MAVIKMNRSHSHDITHARSVAEEIVEEFAEKFGVKYSWDNNTVRFKGAGAKGYMSVFADCIDLKMELGFMLLPFRSKIENVILRHLDDLCV